MKKVFLSLILLGLLTTTATFCFSQSSSIIKVPTHVWSDLAQEERDRATSQYVIDLVPSDSIGVIIDAQGVDRSDPGTTGGQQLGAAFGSAAYVDKAFSGRPDYSAKSHLGTSILGAIIGSTLDRAPSVKYQYRYSVKTLSNKIEYLDDHTTEPFRKSLGACVLVPSLAAVSQDLCSEDVDSFRKRCSLPGRASNTPPPQTIFGEQTKAAPVNLISPATTPNLNPAIVTSQQAEIVRCKFGNNPPVLIDRGVCQSARGELLP
ncbi:MAG: hypothetical protein K8H75_01375 [Sulfuricella sp.]|nr:hypothetical protein [Sulfuricella sp.]